MRIRGRAEVKRPWRTTNLLANRGKPRGLYGAARRKRKRVKPFAAQYILMTVASQPGHKDLHPPVASFSCCILHSYPRRLHTLSQPLRELCCLVFYSLFPFLSTNRDLALSLLSSPTFRLVAFIPFPPSEFLDY